MKKLSATKLYALVFGLFLGLCVWKFGNPVILDHIIGSPVSTSEFFNEAWPTHWANWILPPLVAFGALLVFQRKVSWKSTNWLWLLPLIWLGWQFISTTRTIDAGLTTATLWQFSGCVACYFLGALLFGPENLWRWLLPGLLAAFIFCLVRGVDQHVYEYPQSHQLLMEGERCGWTNFPIESLTQMKTDGIIITTNGTVVANPAIFAKFVKGRISGTLVYPNALAGLILLLLPLAFTLAFETTKELKAPIRVALIGLTIFLGGIAFFWTGSKLGWLVGIGLAGLFLLKLDWSKKLKLIWIAVILILGLGIFAVRFHHYFANGATSVSARFDYWRAAVQTTMANPALGTGPGTFQRPYAQIKAPESEMARLTHNDYLEQFSDSGLLGGLAYAAWIFLAIAVTSKKTWRNKDAFTFAIFTGLIGWFCQGFGEFSLYIPALAWTAFTLLGCLIGQKINQFDK